VVFSCSLYAPLLVQTVRDQMNKSVSRQLDRLLRNHQQHCYQVSTCLFHQTLLSKDPPCSFLSCLHLALQPRNLLTHNYIPTSRSSIHR